MEKSMRKASEALMKATQDAAADPDFSSFVEHLESESCGGDFTEYSEPVQRVAETFITFLHAATIDRLRKEYKRCDFSEIRAIAEQTQKNIEKLTEDLKIMLKDMEGMSI